MIATILSSLMLFGGPPTTVCPIMGNTANPKGPTVEYNGAVYAFCCGGCDTKFAKDPAAALKNPALKGKIAGTYLFDPVSGNRVHPGEVTLFAEFEGTRFFFENEKNLAAFKADSKKYGKLPAKEAMNCPVTGEAVEAYSDASGFADVDGVRYYFCCGGCEKGFTAAKLNPEAKKHVGVPKAIAVKK